MVTKHLLLNTYCFPLIRVQLLHFTQYTMRGGQVIIRLNDQPL